MRKGGGWYYNLRSDMLVHCLHLFIHLNNSYISQESFQPKSFSIKDVVLLHRVFFHIDRKVHLLSVYEMTHFNSKKAFIIV